ncbi:MAG: glutamate--cysteine ligase [Legionellales bacterium]|nr:glutamate--cysteine ligase [Legionellales bacterium]
MTQKLGLFSAVGVEIEYMLVDPQSLNIKPNCDLILEKIAGEITDEVECGEIGISNELVRHVIELKMSSPQPLTENTHQQFHRTVTEVLNPVLAEFNTTLMPSGAHPWLIPDHTIELWPHGNKEIYQAYDKIFGCHGHGFANLQSIHLNLPFANDEEFYRLHSAIRIILPLIPALCASTPFLEGKSTQLADSRLYCYKNNQKKIPIISGNIIPEFVTSENDYHDKILNKIYQALQPLDPEKILQHEWVNSRGAIARFERDAIEIRLMDSQECPLADLTCVAIINGILHYLIDTTDQFLCSPCDTIVLKNLLDEATKLGMQAHCDDKKYLQQFGLAQKNIQQFKALLDKLIEQASHYIAPLYLQTAEKILKHGNLSARLLKAAGKTITVTQLREVYSKTLQCLQANELFMP